jgi:hypothetical protein
MGPTLCALEILEADQLKAILRMSTSLRGLIVGVGRHRAESTKIQVLLVQESDSRQPCRQRVDRTLHRRESPDGNPSLKRGWESCIRSGTGGGSQH